MDTITVVGVRTESTVPSEFIALTTNEKAWLSLTSEGIDPINNLDGPETTEIVLPDAIEVNASPETADIVNPKEVEALALKIPEIVAVEPPAGITTLVFPLKLAPKPTILIVVAALT